MRQRPLTRGGQGRSTQEAVDAALALFWAAIWAVLIVGVAVAS